MMKMDASNLVKGKDKKMNTRIERQSPVEFNLTPEEVQWRDHWPVAQIYAHEGPGPWLVDLSHCPKWDFQSSGLAQLKPWDLAVPERPGNCTLDGRGVLLSRLNGTQVHAWHVGGGVCAPPQLSEGTDVTDAALLLGLVGPRLFRILEKLSALDFFSPDRPVPFLVQGPVSHVPCKIVSFSNRPTDQDALLISCARGYAHDMVHAVLEAGRAFGLRPAGERAWVGWVDHFMQHKGS
jgi:hypothetical protein